MKDFFTIYDTLIQQIAKPSIDALANDNNIAIEPQIVENMISDLRSIASSLLDSSIIRTFFSNKSSGLFLNCNTRADRIEKFCGDFDYDDFFNNYPIAFDLLKAKIKDYVNLIGDIYLAYRQDKEHLEKLIGIKLGSIKKISTALGDLHNGKTVSIVQFEEGKLVYKPHSLLTDAFLEDILSYFSAALDLRIQIPKYLDRRDYGWQEYIDFSPCESKEELKLFYYRIGVYLSVFYLLSTCDMHHENMISFGEFPIFFDTESIVSAPMVGYDPQFRLLPNTVLNTAVLPTYDSNGIYDINFSAIFTGKISPTEKMVSIIREDDVEDFVVDKEKRVLIPPKQINVPTLQDGYELPLDTATNYVTAGFEDSLLIVIRDKNPLFQIYTDKKFEDMELRQVIRPTKVYYTFLLALQSPNAMTSKSKQEEIVEILFDNFSTNSSTGYLRVEREVYDLLHGYIPKFHSVFTQKDLFAYDAVVCSNYYLRTPRDMILNKLDALNNESVAYQKRLIKMSLQTVDLSDFSTSSAAKMIFGTESEIEKIIDKSVREYIDYLVQNTIACSENFSTFMMLYPSREADHFTIKYIDCGMYHGGGLVLLLLTYGHYYNCMQAIRTGRKMLDFFIVNYNQEKTAQSDTLKQSYAYSLYEGFGGLLYLCWYASELLEDDKYLSHYNSICKDIFDFYNSRKIEEIDMDYIRGLSGTLSAMCLIENECQAADSEITDNLTVLCHDYFTAAKTSSEEVIGIAHGTLGTCQALLNAYQFTKNRDYLIFSEQHLSRCIKMSDSLDYSWCRGKAGALMVCNTYIDIAKNTNNSISAELLLARDRIFTELCNGNYMKKDPCLCHGLFGIIDVLISSDEKQNNIAKKRLHHLPAIKKLTEYRWFHATEAPFDSYMMGASGIAYEMLRIVNRKIKPALF